MKEERPWGWYDVIDQGNRYKVKSIEVSPNASLSLQKHLHRAEHWVVVEGTAQVEVDEKIMNFEVLACFTYSMMSVNDIKILPMLR